MIELADAIEIAAPARTIFDLAAPVERWPEILPHYRSVRILSGDARDRIVRMAAWRSAIPIAWVARETIDPESLSIRFEHLRGWTRGMDVVWRFEHLPGRTRVTIVHRLTFRFPVASEYLGKHLVGEFFISHIARKTLACMKRLAEAAHA